MRICTKMGDATVLVATRLPLSTLVGREDFFMVDPSLAHCLQLAHDATRTAHDGIARLPLAELGGDVV